MSELHDRMRQAFKDEAFEILTELETSLLQLEETPGDMEAISSVFRAFHTLKGSGAMSGFDLVSSFTHNIENVYDLVRSGSIVADRALIDLTLASSDLIREMISSSESGETDFRKRTDEIISSFTRLYPQIKGQAKKISLPPAGLSPFLSEATDTATYRIRFKPDRNIFLSGINPLLLLRELHSLGECRVIAHTDEIPELDELDPEACYTYWDAVLTTDKGIDAIRDVFIFVEGQCELKVDLIDDVGTAQDPDDYKRLGEILVEKSEVAREDLERILHERSNLPLGEQLIDEGIVDAAGVEAALAEQAQVRKAREERQRVAGMSSIRVSSHKLDTLVNLVGELVTVQARLSQASSVTSDPTLGSIAEEVERLTGELRANAMDIRMMPIGATFSSFRRLVRDLSAELGKEVDLITAGGDTELDKTVIERLNDPLMHLIRNSIDHGIEMPDIRDKTGKPSKGTVRLAASHSGNHVIIHIMDDGAGLDKDAIREKAISRGIIGTDEILTEQEIFSLVLMPGFTTARNVTNISGRGVGLDVVKKAVDSLRGSIHIESIKGSETSITLILPLTLAIIEGLLIRVAEESFVLPLSQVEECVELTRRDAERSNGRHIANIRGRIVPYISLRERFQIKGDVPEIQQIVVIMHGGQKVGLVVDKVIGEHQTVIKNLGSVFKDVEGISGATILGDGSVALIVDISKVVQNVEREDVEMMR